MKAHNGIALLALVLAGQLYGQSLDAVRVATGLTHGLENGLSRFPDEIAEMDRWIRRHTRERFGPVRHVEPVHVFELGFEALSESRRHRSGVAVR